MARGGFNQNNNIMTNEVYKAAAELFDTLADFEAAEEFFTNPSTQGTAHFEVWEHYGKGSEVVVIPDKYRDRFLALLVEIKEEIKEEFQKP